MNTHADAASYLADLFGPRTAASVFVTSLANCKDESAKFPPRQLITREPEAIERFAAKWDQPGRALFYCVSTLKPGVGRRAKANLAELTGLHADIDFKSVAATEAEILAALEALPLLPHRVNHSGHGLHAYWLFKKALPATEDDIGRLETALKRLATVVAGDPSVCEAARLMRLPGSHNSKDGDWLEVTNLVHREGGYRLEKLEAWLAAAVPVLQPSAQHAVQSNSSDPWLALAAAQIVQAPIDVEQRLAEMQHHGPGESSLHQTQLSTTAALLNKGVPIDEVVAKVLAATQKAVGAEGARWNWRHTERELRGMCETWVAKHPETVAVTEDDDPEETDEEPDEKKPPSPQATPSRGSKAVANLIAAKASAMGKAGVTLHDFHSYKPRHDYIYAPTCEHWPGTSVNATIARIPLVTRTGKLVLDQSGKPKKILATVWLDRHKSIEQITWAPGYPMLVRDQLVAEGGWIKRKKITTFNQYRPPTLIHGDPGKAGPWLDHVHKVYPQDAEHITPWLAHRVQRPAEKINHSLVLGGLQGIGKDSMLEPVKRAVGPWNFHEVSPQHLLGKFCGFLKSVVLRVNEGRDLGEFNRYQFYEQLKPISAAPPDTLRVNEKHLREYYIFNICGVIITTNYKTDGLYLPADDRRHYVAWSDLTKDNFTPAYWKALWRWYDHGGDGHVAAYLAAFDLSSFDPKAPPPKTDAFWAIVDANHPPEEAEFADVLDVLEPPNPDAMTLEMIRDKAIGDFEAWLRDRKNRRTIPYRLEACGYVPIRNPDSKQGLWTINGVRHVIYTKASLSPAERLKAAKKLAG